MKEVHRVLRVERLEDRRLLAAANLLISEFMATNVSTYPDFASEYHDWVEIHNLGSTSVNLSDYSLTDNDSNLQKWTFPSISISAGGYKTVYASAPLDSQGEVIDNYVDPLGVPHANFKLGSEGEYLALTYEDPATNDVSIVHEYSPGFPEQHPNYSFGISSGGFTTYFDTPTPGFANGTGLQGVVADTQFSVDRGFYTSPFQVAITTATAGASIYYTTDGSAPNAAHGTLYAAPLTIDRTTALRAIAVKPDFVPTNVDTHTYFFLNDIVNQTHQDAINQGFPLVLREDNPETPFSELIEAEHGFDPEVIGTFDSTGNPQGDDDFGGIYASEIFDSLTSIPTVSIVMDMDDLFDPTTGIYINSREHGVAWEREASFEWITPDGAPEVQVDAGIRIHGGAFRSHFFSEKHSFRLLFKDEYGPTKLAFPLFGDDAATEFETVVLRTSTNDGYAWRANGELPQYARDEFGRSLQRATGAPSPHNNSAHLYINGTYWGVYSPTERPDADFAASYLGINPDNYDSIHDDEANSGDFVAWNQMLSKAQSASSSLLNFMELQGKTITGVPNPSVAPLLDVENYIDYLMINVWGGSDDWPHHNFWAGRDRSPATTEGFQFFNWDFEGTMGMTREWSPLTKRRLDEGSFTGEFNAGQPHSSLKNNSEYQIQFADRVHKYFFNDGILEPDNLVARYQEIADRVEEFIVAESARWGDMHKEEPLTLEQWRTERDWLLNTYLPQRSDLVLAEFQDHNLYPNVVAPTFSQHGGQVQSGYDLAISAPAGTIYYTLDGSDPRQIGGAIGPNAQIYTGATIDISAGMTVKSRVRSGSTWSALNEADFSVAPPATFGNFAITEFNYNPHDSNPVPGMSELVVDSDEFEFVELRNIGDQTIDLGGVQLTEISLNGQTQGIQFTFSTQTLEPGEHVLVVENLAAFESRYGVGLNVAGEYAGKLSNGGEHITLRDAQGSTIVSFQYNDQDGWPTRSDGNGSSLEVIDVAGNYDEPLNWRPSSEFAGTPGTVGSGPAYDILINEVLSHSDGATLDYVELYNAADSSVDLSGWYLPDNANDLTQYEFPVSTIIAPNSYLLLSETQLGFALDGQFGDSLWLVEADPASGLPVRFADAVVFDATATDISLGRWFSGDGSAVLFPTSSQTLGSQNAGPLLDEVLITELHYNPGAVPLAEQANISQDELEFVELTNSGPASRDISNWLLDGINYSFPADTSIFAEESLLVVSFDPDLEPSKATAFRNVFSVATGVRLFGAAGGRLNNAGERISLKRPEDPISLATGNILVDTLRYDELAPWPTSADGGGDSLNRYSSTAYGEFVSNWRAASPTPGTFSAAPEGDFDLDNDVDGADFLAWQRGFGISGAATRTDGDSNGDGNVGNSDLTAWQATYGQAETTPSIAATSSPLSAGSNQPAVVFDDHLWLIDGEMALTKTSANSKTNSTSELSDLLIGGPSIETNAGSRLATGNTASSIGEGQDESHTSAAKPAADAHCESPWLKDELLEAVFG